MPGRRNGRSTRGTCENKSDRTSPCGQPAVWLLEMRVREREGELLLCESCATELERSFVLRGGRMRQATVDYKARAAYVAKSGITFTADEARDWLIAQGLAGSRGRLSAAQIEAYAEAH